MPITDKQLRAPTDQRHNEREQPSVVFWLVCLVRGICFLKDGLISFLGVLAIYFFTSLQAFAHSPYFGQGEMIDHPDFGVVEFAVLYGDGIIGADPSQVVVFDNDGYLLAATPQSVSFLIRCDRSGGVPACYAYDEMRGLVFEPDYEHWARGRIVEEEGKPPRDAYPEYMDIEYGFTQRTATFQEKIAFDVIGILNAPIATLLAVLWWCLAWSFIARAFWRIKRNGWRALPVKGRAAFLSVVAFSGMSFLAAYAWFLEPYSAYFFWFVFLMGAVVAFAVMRPRRRLAESTIDK